MVRVVSHVPDIHSETVVWNKKGSTDLVTLKYFLRRRIGFNLYEKKNNLDLNYWLSILNPSEAAGFYISPICVCKINSE